MTYYFFSNYIFLKIKIGFGSIVLPKKLGKNIELNNYRLIKDLTPKESKQPNRVGVYTNNENSQKIVVKRHKFLKIDEDVLLLLNEASLLLLNNKNKIFSKKSNINLPEFVGLNISKNELTVATKLVSGQMIFNVSKKKTIDILVQILNQLRTNKSNHIINQLPLNTKSPIYFAVYGTYYLLRLILNDKCSTITYLSLITKFYLYYLFSFPFFRPLSLCHGELFQDSILFDRKTNQINLIDWESACLSDQFFDLALVSRYYFDALDQESIAKIIKDNIKSIKSRTELRRLKGLGIFAAVEYFLNRPINQKSKKQLISYANYISNFEID